MALARVVGRCGCLLRLLLLLLLTLVHALPIAPGLLASSPLSRFSRAIPASCSPPGPATRCLAAGVTAIPAQHVNRAEQRFTTLQQTPTSATTANAGTLNRAQSRIMMLRAHGSGCSPTVKSRSEALNFAPRRFAKRRADARADKPASLPCTRITRIEKSGHRCPTSPRSTNRESAPTVPSTWPPITPPLTVETRVVRQGCARSFHRRDHPVVGAGPRVIGGRGHTVA